ncbi:MAG: hypothetical protein AAB870_01145 [Patescibacteria group bacterium]
MPRYMCGQCGDDFATPGSCEICLQPLEKMEKEENEEQPMFNDEDYN